MFKITLTKISKEILVFISFFILTLILRFKGLNYRIIDWDESLYFMWAKDLFNGILPYESIMENKPIGIGLIYTLSFLLFGSKSMFSVKMLALFFISASSFFLYKIGRILNPNNYSELTGLLAGIFYCIFSCYNSGFAENTEIFFIFFTTVAFYLLFKNIQELDFSKANYKTFFFIGLFLGLGFLIKYVVLFDLISLLLILTLFILFKNQIKNNFVVLFRLFLFIFLGFILPQITVIAAYTMTGKLNFFINDTLFTFKYASCIPFSFNERLNNLFTFLSSYNLLFYSLVLFIFTKAFLQKNQSNLIYTAIWFLIILLELIFFLTHYFDHYCMQILPSLCLLSSYLITNGFLLVKNNLFKILLSIFFIISLLLIYKQTFNYIDFYLSAKEKAQLEFKFVKGRITPIYNDTVSLAADYIKKNIGTGKYIFVLSEDYILYDMTNCKHTSKHIMPYQLLDNHSSSIINQQKEIKKIMQDKPEYIILPIYNDKDSNYYNLFVSNILIYEQILKYISNFYFYDIKFGYNALYRLRHLN